MQINSRVAKDASGYAKFKNFPASGLQIVWRDMVTSQFYEGLIAEEWVLTDLVEQSRCVRAMSPLAPIVIDEGISPGWKNVLPLP